MTATCGTATRACASAVREGDARRARLPPSRSSSWPKPAVRETASMFTVRIAVGLRPPCLPGPERLRGMPPTNRDSEVLVLFAANGPCASPRGPRSTSPLLSSLPVADCPCPPSTATSSPLSVPRCRDPVGAAGAPGRARGATSSSMTTRRSTLAGSGPWWTCGWDDLRDLQVCLAALPGLGTTGATAAGRRGRLRRVAADSGLRSLRLRRSSPQPSRAQNCCRHSANPPRRWLDIDRPDGWG